MLQKEALTQEHPSDGGAHGVHRNRAGTPSASLPIPTPNTQHPPNQPKWPGPVQTILLLQDADCSKSISTYSKHPTGFV